MRASERTAHRVPRRASEGLSTFADAVGCQATADGQRIVCAYSDRSIVVWDTKDLKTVGKYRTLHSHAACIWCVRRFDWCAPGTDHATGTWRW